MQPTLAPRMLHSVAQSWRSTPILRPRRPLRTLPTRRTLIAPPTANSGPLMERRADRELPEVGPSYVRWLKTLPIFIAIIGASSLAIFNYQKTSSSVVQSTLYALRTSPRARQILGDEIYFRDKFPWVWGELNQLHGRIDIGVGVKGKTASGFMRFKSFRKTKMSFFETVEWSLETEDGQIVHLLEPEVDPFKNSALQAEPKPT